jgi:hypothetical protein
VRVRVASILFTPGQRTNSENVVEDGQEIAALIATNASHILARSFFIPSSSSLVIHLDYFLRAAGPCEEWHELF